MGVPARSSYKSRFNEERVHGELGNLSPAGFEAEYGRRSPPSAA
jgi:transposase InsO family protein